MAASLSILLSLAFAQPAPDAPLKTTLCEIVSHPDAYHHKRVEFRAVVEPGLQDLPVDAVDATCGAEVKFLGGDDAMLSHLLKNKEFQKMAKYLSKNDVVEADITGWFARSGSGAKPESGLVLESVARVTHRPGGPSKR
jgi:hypothetical protein